MKILVMSDTHRAIREAVYVISACSKGCDLVIHLGDLVTDFNAIKEAFPDITFVGVSGNNDFFSSPFDEECTLDLDGIKTFICHGHQYAVKRTTDSLLWKAQAKEATLALYGHTHVQDKEIIEGVTLFNPGAMCEGDFGIIHIEKGVIASISHHRFDRFTRRII